MKGRLNNMSREIPLLASEKIKLGCLIFFILMLLIPGLFGAYKSIYRAIVRDKEAYERNMEKLCEYYDIEVIESNTKTIEYDIAVNYEKWKAMSNDQRFNYCDNIYGSINKTLRVCKMIEEEETSSIDFFVNNRRIAYINGGYIHLLD